MLQTKLHIPPTGNMIIPRVKLFEKLDVGLDRKLILISAPAGYGKTTLLCNWIENKSLPTTWYSIDKGDNDPVVFFNYIISGLQLHNEEIGQRSMQFLAFGKFRIRRCNVDYGRALA